MIGAAIDHDRSNTRYYESRPVRESCETRTGYVQPAPRVIYAPPPVVYSRPVPVVYGGWSQHSHQQYRDSDRDGIPDRWDRYDNRQRWDREHDGHKVPHRVVRDDYGDKRR